MRSPRLVMIAAALVGCWLAMRIPAVSADDASELAPGPWSAAEVLARCHAVVETAIADYERIDATLTSGPAGARVALRSADDFPVAGFEAKLCTWSDRDGDRRIGSSEEATVRVFTGPLRWSAGTRSADAVVRDQLQPGDCARLWIYATYPNGARSTKRSSIACLAVAPAASVPESPYAVLPAATGVLSIAVAAMLLRRRAQRASTGTPSYL